MVELTVGKLIDEYTNNMDAKILYKFDKSIIGMYKNDVKTSVELLESIVLQLINYLNPSNCIVYFYEDIASHNFAQLKYLYAKTEKNLVEQLFTQKDISQLLNNLNEEMLKRYTSMSAIGAKNIFEYNTHQKLPLVNKFVVLSKIVTLLQKDSTILQNLDNIIKQGALAGIYIILDYNKNDIHEYDLSDDFIDKINTFITKIKSCMQGFNITTNSYKMINNDEYYQQFLDEFGCEPVLNANLNKSLTEKIVLQITQNQNETVIQDFLKVKIGTMNTQDAFFALGSASVCFHTLISGMSGSGKTIFVQNILLQTCEKYTPTDIQFILLDFGGNSFHPYSDIEHFLYVFDEPNKSDMVINMFDFLLYELSRRKELFTAVGKKYGVTIDTLHKYQKYTNTTLPKLVIVIDEFGVLMNNNTNINNKRVNNTAEVTINALAREGRKFGIHIILISQSFVAITIPNEVRPNASLRIALKAGGIRDSNATLDNTNDQAYYINNYQAVINNDFGKPQSNKIIDLDDICEDTIIERQQILKQKYKKTRPSYVENYVENILKNQQTTENKNDFSHNGWR